MAMDDMVRGIYKVILEDIAEYYLVENDLRIWEKENRVMVENGIRQLLIGIAQSGLVSANPLLIPPPDWESVYIGEGVFVPGKNPELECEVVWWPCK